MDKTILLRPNTGNGYNKEFHSLKAIEPPLWLMCMANYYKTDILIDSDAKNYTIQETIDKVLS